MPDSHIQRTFYLPASLSAYVEEDGAAGCTFTLAVEAALVHFFAEVKEDERRLWFRAMRLVKKGKLDWRQASSWIAEHRVEEIAA